MNSVASIKRFGNNGVLITYQNEYLFFSYDSRIFKYKIGEITFYRNYDYSSTTQRERKQAFEYLGWDELNSTAKVKKAIEDGKVMFHHKEIKVIYDNEN